MSVLGTILLVLLALLAALVGAVVIFPFEARAWGRVSDDDLRGHVMATWLLGLVGFQLSSARGGWLLLAGHPVWRIESDDEDEDEETKRKKAAKKAEKARKKKEKALRKKEKKRAKKAKRKAEGKEERGFLDYVALFLDHRSTMWRAVARILRTFRLRLRIHGTVGMHDPADTAKITNALYALGSVADWAEIDVVPDYLDEALDLQGEASARIWILGLIGAALRSLFELDTWRMLRAWA